MIFGTYIFLFLVFFHILPVPSVRSLASFTKYIDFLSTLFNTKYKIQTLVQLFKNAKMYCFEMQIFCLIYYILIIAFLSQFMTKHICITIIFNNPIKASFSNKKNPVTIQIRTTQFVSIFHF